MEFADIWSKLRAYVFYSGNTATRQDLADPRFEVVDGTEPTIASMLVPPDADNTEKRRMIPDAEFSDPTPAQHWQVVPGSGSGNVTFSPTGGLVGGRAILTWGSAGTATELRALRTPPYQPVGRARVYMRLRIQRTASLTGDLVLNVEAPQWDGGSNYNTGNLATITLNNTTLPSVNTWVEFTASVAFLTATASRPYATVRLSLIPSGTTNGQSVELDAFPANVEADTFSAEAAGMAPKTSAASVGQQFLRDDGTWQAMNTDHLVTDYADDASTSYTLGNGDAESIRRFTSSSAITITLPNSIPTGWAIGDSMGIIRGGTGTLTFSTAGTLRSEGGSTITVQNGKACVTLAGSGIWELSGRV